MKEKSNGALTNSTSLMRHYSCPTQLSYDSIYADRKTFIRMHSL